MKLCCTKWEFKSQDTSIMHKSPGCSVMIMFVLEWRGISYLEKGGKLLGPCFFQGRQGGEKPCSPRSDRGGPHSPAVTAKLCLAHPGFGQWSLRAAYGVFHGLWWLSFQLCIRRGAFSLCLFIYVPANSIRSLFRHFLPSINRGSRDTITKVKI